MFNRRFGEIGSGVTGNEHRRIRIPVRKRIHGGKFAWIETRVTEIEIYTEGITSVNDLIKTSFDLSEQPDGIYFIRVFGEGSYTVKKIIKN